MRQSPKLAKFRWNTGRSEVVVGKIESLEVVKGEKTTIGIEGTVKPTTIEVEANHMTNHSVTNDPIP